MKLSEVAERENVSVGYIQTVVNVLAKTDATHWNGWVFRKERGKWEATKLVETTRDHYKSIETSTSSRNEGRFHLDKSDAREKIRQEQIAKARARESLVDGGNDNIPEMDWSKVPHSAF